MHACSRREADGAQGFVTSMRALLAEPGAVAPLGLYPIVTFQYSSTTLYQFSYHIQ
jgi:hypothetical protein